MRDYALIQKGKLKKNNIVDFKTRLGNWFVYELRMVGKYISWEKFLIPRAAH